MHHAVSSNVTVEQNSQCGRIAIRSGLNIMKAEKIMSSTVMLTRPQGSRPRPERVRPTPRARLNNTGRQYFENGTSDPQPVSRLQSGFDQGD